MLLLVMRGSIGLSLFISSFGDEIGWVLMDGDREAKNRGDHSFKINNSDEGKVRVDTRKCAPHLI